MGNIWNIKEQYKRQMGNLWQRGTPAGRAIMCGGYVEPGGGAAK